ncbi:MAG: SDR family oxidoreductase [Kiloniellales bacterium]
MGRVDGKMALVTGAGSGIGRATSILLAKEGAKVAACDIDQKTASATAQAINADPGYAGPGFAEASRPDSAMAMRHDVTDEEGWRDVLARVVTAFGGLNILVNNAGISAGGNVEETDFETWRRVHSVDLDSVFLGCKYAIRHIHASGGGSIVNISSISGIIAGHNMASYNSAKAGVRLLSKSVALHCAKQGYDIRCNSVHPAFIKTPILDPLVHRFGKAEAYAKLARQVPLGRIGEAQDVAHGVLYLASDESRFVTGTELVIDGGISAM